MLEKSAGIAGVVLLRKNLGGGCRSVEEVLQRGVLEGVLGMLLHKGCMKDVTVLQSYISVCIRFHECYQFSGYPGRD